MMKLEFQAAAHFDEAEVSIEIVGQIHEIPDSDFIQVIIAYSFDGNAPLPSITTADGEISHFRIFSQTTKYCTYCRSTVAKLVRRVDKYTTVVIRLLSSFARNVIRDIGEQSVQRETSASNKSLKTSVTQLQIVVRNVTRWAECATPPHQQANNFRPPVAETFEIDYPLLGSQRNPQAVVNVAQQLTSAPPTTSLKRKTPPPTVLTRPSTDAVMEVDADGWTTVSYARNRSSGKGRHSPSPPRRTPSPQRQGGHPHSGRRRSTSPSRRQRSASPPRCQAGTPPSRRQGDSPVEHNIFDFLNPKDQAIFGPDQPQEEGTTAPAPPTSASSPNDAHAMGDNMVVEQPEKVLLPPDRPNDPKTTSSGTTNTFKSSPKTPLPKENAKVTKPKPSKVAKAQVDESLLSNATTQVVSQPTTKSPKHTGSSSESGANTGHNDRL